MQRKATWAKPQKYCGVPNFHLLDEHLSRSAQPTADGMKVLREAGFKTIINLRNWHSDLDEIGTTGLALEEIPISAFKPNLDEVTRFLQIVSQKDRGPILVHCLHGADRTGMMCAFYRICFQDWSKEDAIEEMVEGGYGHHRKMFANLPEFIWDLDIEALKARAGIPFVMKACP
ncbi:MAG: dual specificity protein phosphatase family protein [Planctomycetes bacterium]|nr:dual specificity protein phosphatase family protein [Planctomycetota bacterium]